jgi:VWFA-related protein
MTSDKQVLHSVVQEIQRRGTTRELRASIGRGDSAAAHMNTDVSTPDDASGERVHQQIASFVTQNKNFDEEMSLVEQTMFAASSTAAIVEAARAFGNSEGRKMILLVTGHMPFGQVSPLSRVGEGPILGNHIENITRNDKQLTTMRDHLIHEANASNTSFYIIDAEGLEPPSMDGVTYSSLGGLSPGSAAQDHSSEYWLAAETGGAYLPGNRMEQSFEEIDRRSANFYSLGFASKHADDMRYHRIVVRVKGHSGLRLQYRAGYSSAETDIQLVRALRSPLGATMQEKTMAMSLILGNPQYHGPTALVPLQASMSMESLQYITDARGSRTRLHVYVSIFDADGRNLTVAKSFADIAVRPNEATTGPMTVTIPPLALGKGTYNVVVAVRDELTDHVGVATHKIRV